MSRIRFPAARPARIGAACAILLVLAPIGTVSASGGRDTQAAYDLGKAIMQRDLACEDCALAHLPRTQEEAREVARRIQAGEIGAELSEQQRWAVRVYLEVRWDL